jgi:hypothetical protein
MTEAEWLTCNDPDVMLNHLRDNVSDRKLRLFAVACCRQVWSMLATSECRQAVGISEHFADDPSVKEELMAACLRVSDIRKDSRGFSHPADTRRGASYNAACLASTSKMWHVSDVAAAALLLDPRNCGSSYQCGLLRDIFRNPFRPVTANPAWLLPSVVALAQSIYDDRAFERLPELSEALVAARCDNQQILDHCRSEGQHVRGCWVVDLVLGKE